METDNKYMDFVKQQNITKETILPFIREAYKELSVYMRLQSIYGMEDGRDRRVFLKMYETLGDADTNAEKYADEYLLIMGKKSILPSNIRCAVQLLVGRAISIYANTIKENMEKSQQAEMVSVKKAKEKK